jgi:hypothetical protein
LGSAVIIHPYHPFHGQRFSILKLRKVGSVQTAILLGSDSGTFAVPLSWTDRGPPSPRPDSNEIPQFLSAPNLWALVELLESLSPQDEREGGL